MGQRASTRRAMIIRFHGQAGSGRLRTPPCCETSQERCILELLRCRSTRASGREGAGLNALDHEALQQRLASGNIEADGSELHGILCGLVCSGEPDAEPIWLGEIFSEATDQQDLLIQECRDALRGLFRETHALLTGSAPEFDLLLPGDEHPLSEVAASVSNWCQGFLYGIGLSGLSAEQQLSEEIREALNDISEIAKMDLKGIGNDETEEAALTEIVEFLRVAAMLLREELVHERSVEG